MQELDRRDPESVGRFRILARIGSGGMAVVYFGRSVGGRAVAVKMMHTEFADDPEHRARFHREVTATQTVGGTYSPGVLDADSEAIRPWMATEFLPAISLREAVRRFGALSTDSVWPLAAGLGEALTVIHRAGFVHLDVKPANVLLTTEGPRIIDFGIAQELHGGHPVDKSTIAGSRGFMSPEQEDGGLIGPPSDVFSFGSTLTYACLGVAPAVDFPLPIADDKLRTMIESCLRADPAARPSLPELVEQLTSVASTVGRQAWLSSPVAAEISRRIGEVENPPGVVPPQPDAADVVRRRVLLFGVCALTAGAGVSALTLIKEATPPTGKATPKSNDTPRKTANTSANTEPSTAPSPVPRFRELEIIVTGDVVLTSYTYTINGQATTLNNLTLPWRTSIDVPESPTRGTWRIEYHTAGPGEVTFRVMLDRILQGYRSRNRSPGSFSDSGEGTI